MLTDRPLCGLLELREEMCHRFVEVVFGEGLRVVHGERGDERDDHLADVGIAVGLEVEDLFCGVEEVLFHELFKVEYAVLAKLVGNRAGSHHAAV